jgi:hypothetical protein
MVRVVVTVNFTPIVVVRSAIEVPQLALNNQTLATATASQRVGQ